MQPHSNTTRIVSSCLVVAAALLALHSRAAIGQVAAPPAGGLSLTVNEAIRSSLATSPDIIAARHAAAAALGRERQAGARENPTFGYGRERTGTGASASSQQIVELDQALEVGGTIGARREAARFRREAAESRVRLVETQVAYDVTVAFARASSADRRAALASRIADAFREAERVADARLAAGDVSGFTARRIRLEANRYSVLSAEALLESRTARLELWSLMPPDTDRERDLDLNLQAIRESVASLVADSGIVLRRRADLVALALDERAAIADAALARRERTPVPVLTAGTKRESTGAEPSRGGFVAGVRLPLPLWDRRGGAIEAAVAESRRRSAELASAERVARRELAAATDALRTAGQQLDLMTPALSADAAASLRSAQAAYAEGEISLLEWLDAARAYHEVESGFANLRSEFLIRAAELAKAAGTNLNLPDK